MNPDGTNNVASFEGWSNMQVGKGYDDPAFVLSVLRQYDESHKTNYYTSVTKLHGRIGFLNFRGDQGLKERDAIIQRAYQEVTDLKNSEFK